MSAGEECAELLLPVRAFREALRQPRWSEAANMRALAGGAVRRLLAHWRGPRRDRSEYAFLAADLQVAGFRLARRSVVALAGAVVTFDYAVAEADCRRVVLAVDGKPEVRGSAYTAGGISGAVALPGGGEPAIEPREGELLVQPRKARDELMFVHVAQFGAPAPVEMLWSLDLAGARVGDTAVLFHAAPRLSRGALWFEAERGHSVTCIVTGLAPGTWEIWRNGWLEDAGGAVEPGEGVLYFEGESGRYYLRPLS